MLKPCTIDSRPCTIDSRIALANTTSLFLVRLWEASKSWSTTIIGRCFPRLWLQCDTKYTRPRPAPTDRPSIYQLHMLRIMLNYTYLNTHNITAKKQHYYRSLKARSHCWNSDVTVMKQWWNSDETVMKEVESAWNRMNQSDETVMKHVESGWISNETISFMVVKHRETRWIRMKHGHETPWIRMKHCFMVMKHLELGWNSVFHGHETRCFMPMKYLESGTVTTEISIFLYWFWFMVFHCAVSCCFIAVSCSFITVSLLFHCCFMLFHCCFAVFHGVSRCFIALFHDHETGAVGTSLE